LVVVPGASLQMEDRMIGKDLMLNRRTLALVAVAAVMAGCARNPKPAGQPPASPTQAGAAVSALPALVPIPAVMEMRGGSGFQITAKTVIQSASSDPSVAKSVASLTEWIRRGTGLALTSALPNGEAAGNTISIAVDPSTSTGPEGYELTIDTSAITLKASTPAGIFYGVQTLRQLLPYWSEYEAIMYQRPRPATLPALRIQDAPRYAWRGAMLDVSRHFFTVEDVKRYVDLLALHKMNRLHLHLADDQGWRIEIAKWPDLTAKGGLTEVGGTPGGFYTKAQFADLTSYAADRFVTIVPEIDMPGHTNAALSSYAQLNCNGQAPPVFTGTEVGFSAFCVEKEETYQFIDDVVGEIAAMTPGKYFHMGGDEVKRLTPAQYKLFVERVQAIVQKHGKEMIGWDEVAATTLLPTSIVQHWRPDAAKSELARAPRLILSPADRAYIDMKYDDNTALGLKWAALIPVKNAYDWNPSTLVPGAAETAILGVEAPMWSETLANIRDVEFMAMPRLAAIAEVGWSSAAQHNWDTFRVRLGGQAPRWIALGVNFYRAPEIPWK
jgi:hexosaminidase